MGVVNTLPNRVVKSRTQHRIGVCAKLFLFASINLSCATTLSLHQSQQSPPSSSTRNGFVPAFSHFLPLSIPAHPSPHHAATSSQNSHHPLVAQPWTYLTYTPALQGLSGMGRSALGCSAADARRHRASSLKMISERQPGWEGYPKRNNLVFPEDALTGSWEISWSEEDRMHETTLVLHADGSVTPPSSGEGSELDKPRFQRGTWRFKGSEITIVIKPRLGSTVRVMQGNIVERKGVHYGSLVTGNVLEGESDRDWLGCFTMNQVVGKAVFGMAPGKPKPEVASKASTGFALGGRSEQKVLKRFEGSWATSMMMDGQRVMCDVKLFRNGTFESENYRKFSPDGVETTGVLRGRWNVYFSQDVGKDRFWMQAKRLWCSNLNLWTDLLFLGDIAVVDTWQDLQKLLSVQTAEFLAAQEEAAAREAAAEEEEEEEAAAEEEKETRRGAEEEGRQPELSPRNASSSSSSSSDLNSSDLNSSSSSSSPVNASTSLSAEDLAQDGAAAAAERAGEEEEQKPLVPMTPEERGIFTRGKKRQYELSGTILAGHQLEPAIVGQFHMMQDGEGYDDDFLDTLRSGDVTE